MRLKKKNIILIALIIVVICVLLTGLINIFGKNTLSYAEKKLKISLTDSVEVIESEKTVEFGEEHIDLKLSVNEGKLDAVKAELNTFFSQERFKGMSKEEINNRIPNFQNTCSWWDLDKNNITDYYEKMIEGNRVKTLDIWAFVTEENGENYLYISY